MKIKVNRLLTAGKFNVNFEVGDFTPEETRKMGSFGVPQIEMKWMSQNTPNVGRVPMTQISSGYNMQFPTADAAKTYEDSIVTQLKSAIERLRQAKDDFTSTAEVEL